MEINYGIKAAPPTRLTAGAFGVDEEPVRLEGGQGTSYRAGEIVLKPTGTENGRTWRAELFGNLPDVPDVRFARPVLSVNDTWEYDGYVAWTLLKGEHVKGRYDEKLKASIAFHKILQSAKKPHAFDKANCSWSVGDQVALDQIDFNYDQDFMELYNQVKPHLKLLPADRQLIHGDLGGNFLMDDVLPPAIIDFSPAWAPNGFAEGIMLADAIAWDGASLQELDAFKQIPNIKQFGLRGALRRITEQAEHMKWFGKDKASALKEAKVFEKAIHAIISLSG